MSFHVISKHIEELNLSYIGGMKLLEEKPRKGIKALKTSEPEENQVRTRNIR